MATYAIGDVQGCYRPLRRLLEIVRFDRSQDRLWFVGDLVNRGPRSLEVLRFVRDLGDRAVVVLGNHDLRLIAVHSGVGPLKKRDNFGEVLSSKDADDLTGWLQSRPLLHRDGELLMVHAGLHPAWDGSRAEAEARNIEVILRGAGLAGLLRRLLDESGSAWSHSQPDDERAGAALRRMVTLRACDAAGRMCEDFSGPPEETPGGFKPWFAIEGRKSAGSTVIFGHWAAMGLRCTPRLLALDSGCAWGNALTAVRLEDRAVFQAPAGT